MSGAPQENDNNIEVVEARAGPAQTQSYPQRGYGGPQTRPWGGPQSWTRPAPQWSGPMGYSATTDTPKGFVAIKERNSGVKKSGSGGLAKTRFFFIYLLA